MIPLGYKYGIINPPYLRSPNAGVKSPPTGIINGNVILRYILGIYKLFIHGIGLIVILKTVVSGNKNFVYNASIVQISRSYQAIFECI